MKRIIAILLLLGTLFMFTACPGGEQPVVPPNENPGDTPGGPENPDTPDDPNNPGGEIVPVEPTYAQTYPYEDENGVLHIRYQDTYTFKSEIREIKDVVITSKVTGTDTPDAKLLVLQSDNKSIYADGCGSATVVFRGRETKVQVDPSPINMLFVTGQSNASGDGISSDTPGYEELKKTYAQYYKRTEPTMAYFTFGDQRLSIDPAADYADLQAAENPMYSWGSDFRDYTQYVPTTLDWETASNRYGAQPQVFADVNNTSFASAGWSAALAYEWNRVTGERVWVVNVSQGGMEIQQFMPREDEYKNNEYYQAVKTFNLALETLYKEVDAGHFTLNHMAYYWFHGESNSAVSELNYTGKYAEYLGGSREYRFNTNRGCRYMTAQEYAEAFAKVHAGFMQDVVYNHNGVTKELEYCGIMTVRTKVGEKLNNYDQIGMTGARTAEYFMGASLAEGYDNVYVVSNVTENWIGKTTEEADANTEAYFLKTYGSAAKFKEIFGYDMPTTAFEVHPQVHYLMKGHNEMGMDCARNSLRIILLTNPENCYKLPNESAYSMNEEVSIVLIGEDGYSEIDGTVTLNKDGQAVLYPQITPLFRAVEGIELKLESPGYTLENYVLTKTMDGYDEVLIKLFYDGKECGSYLLTVE